MCQDILSLWDLHFLVMIHCWPDLTIHDFELTTECGSASMVAYVSVCQEQSAPFYTNLRLFFFILQPRQGQHENDHTDKARKQSGNSRFGLKQMNNLKFCSAVDPRLFLFQISSLQIRFLPSMSVCYSLDVSSVSCLLQMKTNMVNDQTV